LDKPDSEKESNDQTNVQNEDVKDNNSEEKVNVLVEEQAV